MAICPSAEDEANADNCYERYQQQPIFIQPPTHWRIDYLANDHGYHREQPQNMQRPSAILASLFRGLGISQTFRMSNPKL
jgi:hypothetical protein